MPIHLLNDDLWFPPADDALGDGLLAIGGDISIERLLKSYSLGIFPWYDDGPPLWWCPDPRFVLFPDELKVSKSMARLLRRDAFRFSVNQAFAEVIYSCKQAPREGQSGTWINNDIEKAFNQLHHKGFAISAEAWVGDELAGGLYGVIMGKVFFGESMFSHQSNASKFAFIKMVSWLIKQGVELIDCQVYTEHLESLGARMIDRKYFLEMLQLLITQRF